MQCFILQYNSIIEIVIFIKSFNFYNINKIQILRVIIINLQNSIKMTIITFMLFVIFCFQKLNHTILLLQQ